MVSSSRPAATIEQCCRSSLTSKAMAILLIIRSILSRRARRRALPLRAPVARKPLRAMLPPDADPHEVFVTDTSDALYADAVKGLERYSAADLLEAVRRLQREGAP